MEAILDALGLGLGEAGGELRHSAGYFVALVALSLPAVLVGAVVGVDISSLPFLGATVSAFYEMPKRGVTMRLAGLALGIVAAALLLGLI